MMIDLFFKGFIFIFQMDKSLSEFLIFFSEDGFHFGLHLIGE